MRENYRKDYKEKLNFKIMAHIRPSEEACKHVGGIEIPLRECEFEYISSPGGDAPDENLFYGVIESLPLAVMSKEHAKGPITTPEGWHDYDPLEFKVRRMDHQLELHPVNDDVGCIRFIKAVSGLFSNAHSHAFIFDVRSDKIDEVVLYLTNGL